MNSSHSPALPWDFTIIARAMLDGIVAAASISALSGDDGGNDNASGLMHIAA